jgi:two-component system, NtrC family, nitrogen regulation sensor histidine kinase NtrY
MRWSIEARLAALQLAWLVGASVLSALLGRYFGDAVLGVVVAIIVGAVPVILVARRAARPVIRLLRAMTGAVGSYRDGDFSHSLVSDRSDELGQLIHSHNELAQALREQHTHLVQRELLLDTITQNSPLALVLVDSHGRVAYANHAAGQLLNDGRSIVGRDFDRILQSSVEPLRAAVNLREDCLFSAEINCVEETFHVAKRSFQLLGRTHQLYLFRRLTRELSRQEVSTWKKLIRVLSHELNNSLAPAASLAQSGAELARRRQLDDVGGIFRAIGERTEHLHQFILRYADLAKLPTPRPVPVGWDELLEEITRHQPCCLEGILPQEPGWFDRAQIGQALVNLVKNARESGSAPEQIAVAVSTPPGEYRIEVRDRGPGMSETVMSQALLPFYSTKRSGTGLGLALVREIAEAHGGHIRLSNREGGGLCATLTLPMPANPQALHSR